MPPVENHWLFTPVIMQRLLDWIKEQDLIISLFFEEISLSDYARSKGKTPQFIYKCRNNIFKKIKEILEKMV